MEAALSSSLGHNVLGQTPFKIGRAPDNTLVISDPQASAHHVEIAPGYGGNGYQITDLNSTNGTFINEQRLSPNLARPLYSGDVIRIGTTTFTYTASASGASYPPTERASSPNYEPTVYASPPAPPAQPSYPQPPAPPAYQQPPVQQTPASYGNAGWPAQLQATPPPVYPQPAYPQPQSYPQQAYPQPGGFGQPMGYPPPQKKSRAGCWIAAIIILVLLVGGGGGAYYYFQVRSTPQKTLQAYCDGWKTSNAQEIYDQLDSAQQAKTSVSDVQKALSVLNTLGGSVTNCTVNSTQQSGSTATGVITLTLEDGRSINLHDTLIQENGTWKIDAETGTPNA